MHIHAVSASTRVAEYQLVFQSLGQPDHGDGMILGSPVLGGSVPVIVTPCGSPGFTFGGPTVPGAAVGGSFPFGTSGDGGRIARENRRGTTTTVNVCGPARRKGFSEPY
jgi:hypothetical protein